MAEVVVSFVVIGAMKSGTTTLTDQLTRHPSICFSRVKEPNFFNRSDDWRAELPSYHAAFEPREGQICGEGSTQYTNFPDSRHAAERLHAYNPDLKLLYLMRDPVERAISHYAYEVVRGRAKPEDVDAALLGDPRFVNWSRYGVQLRRYIELFGRDQVMPLVSEEFLAEQSAGLRRVAEFIGVEPDFFDGVENAHSLPTVSRPFLSTRVWRFRTERRVDTVARLAPGALKRWLRTRLSRRLDHKPEPSPCVRRLLGCLLEDDVRFVEELLERPVTAWHLQP